MHGTYYLNVKYKDAKCNPTQPKWPIGLHTIMAPRIILGPKQAINQTNLDDIVLYNNIKFNLTKYVTKLAYSIDWQLSQ